MPCLAKQRRSASFRQIFALWCLCLFILSGCAGTKDSLEGLPRFIKARTLWDKFQSTQNSYLAQTKAISIQGSLRYASKEQKHRFSINLWGNLSGPFRLNLQTSFGQIFSLWRIDSNSTVAFYPHEQKVFLSQDPQQTILASLGIHFPFPFPDLPWVLASVPGKIIPEDYQDSQRIPGKGWQYQLGKDQPIRNIVIGHKGQVLQLSGTIPFSWHIFFDDFTVIRDHPIGQKIILENEFKEKLVFYLGEFKDRDTLWPPKTLQLNLPENIEYIYL